ncbi:riboflavin synthase domain-like protein [Artomyces pyxidatus]|uniref:Riboflavin synthase domain-like protein n=1 Tax=Artomyces pyxidatus TaxID=48021 RepID=A0ACB8SZL7_9AGAM|nr:riboflavin synthase domain-like protein [Artomyces pyxidatus]
MSLSSSHQPPILTILYATETGNAQEYADRVARGCRRLPAQSRVFSMDKYPLEDLIHEHFIIFVVATAGTGKEPRTMTPLWKMLLRSDLPADFFEDHHYSVFGLGDTAYEKFCWPAKKLSRRLDSLGATEICPRGEGDSQHPLGTDGAFEPWLANLTASLAHILNVPGEIQAGSSTDDVPTSRITLRNATATDLDSARDPLLEDTDYHTFELLKNDRITAQDWSQDVRHIELRCEHDISYEPGDIASIHPEAPSDDVGSFLTTAGWANIADEPFHIVQLLKDQSLPDHLPPVSTLRTIFTRYLDINAVPKRSFFRLFRNFTSDDREKEKLDEFVSPEGADDLYDYTQRVRRTIREVVEEFRNTRIPKDYIFDLFPPLRPREFSIASSPKRHKNEVHLCVAIVQYRTKLKIPRRGVGTTFLASLQPGTILRIGITKGLLELPPDLHTPVICVGPGTGIAPMRALLEGRIHDGSIENTLYFGCRSAAKDQHYHTEWMDGAARGELVYRVACSRDGPEGVQRTYVQALIEEDANRVWRLVDEQRAWVYISGSSNKMPAGVRKAIENVARVEGGLGEDEAKEYVATMEKQGRLFEECWS